MTEYGDPERIAFDMAVRKEAARCARMLLEASRRHDVGGGSDVREMLMLICSRYGHANVIELADAEPQAVIELWEAVELLEQDSYDSVLRRSKEDAAP